MPLDFTGNDPNKFQDVQQFAEGDPRAIIQPTQEAYNAALAHVQAPIPEAPVRPDGGFQNPGQALEYRNSMRAHNQALSDAAHYADTAKYLHDTLHNAQIKADAGAFHTEFAHIGADDPEIHAKASALLAQSPLAASDPSVLHSLNMKLEANAKHVALNEANQKSEEAYNEKASKVIAAGKAEGTLLDSDFPEWDGKGKMPQMYQRNPRTGNIGYNMDFAAQLSASRRAQGIGTKAETAEMAAARHTYDAMKLALANPDLLDTDPKKAMYLAAQDQALQTIATGTAPNKPATAAAGQQGTGVAPASKPASKWVVRIGPQSP